MSPKAVKSLYDMKRNPVALLFRYLFADKFILCNLMFTETTRDSPSCFNLKLSTERVAVALLSHGCISGFAGCRSYRAHTISRNMTGVAFVVED